MSATDLTASHNPIAPPLLSPSPYGEAVDLRAVNARAQVLMNEVRAASARVQKEPEQMATTVDTQSYLSC